VAALHVDQPIGVDIQTGGSRRIDDPRPGPNQDGLYETPPCPVHRAGQRQRIDRMDHGGDKGRRGLDHFQ